MKPCTTALWALSVQKQPGAVVLLGDLVRKLPFLCRHQSPCSGVASLPLSHPVPQALQWPPCDFCRPPAP